MSPLSEYENLSREERLRRVARLMLKAVTLHEIRLAKEAQLSEAPSFNQALPVKLAPEEIAASTLDEAERSLLAWVCRLLSVSPREVADFLKLSKTTTFRRLKRLERDGWLVREGATNAVRYIPTLQTLTLMKQVKQTVQV